MVSQAQSEANVYRVPRLSARVGDIPEQLLAGTHLIIYRRGYTHHGIYLGDGRVVHYAGRIKYPQGLIEEISLAEFSEGRALRAKILRTGRFNGSEIVRRARSRLGERRYDLLRNNCEHFCNWCRLGENRSFQVECLTAPVRLVRSALLRLCSTYRSIRRTPLRMSVPVAGLQL
jgi:cell wall-associated NlpC family hydrolase